MTEWMSFEYRDFYDVPRAVVVRIDDRLLLLDCLLDFETEEYPDTYDVYEVPGEFECLLHEMSWTDLGHKAKSIGTLAVEDVEFDETRRRLINGSFVERIQKA